jgi:hypothetical protein
MNCKRLLGCIAAPLVLALAGCGGVEVAAESQVPTPLVDPLPLTVGVFYSEAFSKYAHTEERWGVDWKADLGPYHVRMGERLFSAAFREVIPVKDLANLPPSPPYAVIIEPRIEQYSFITPKDTGADYYAVTIKYRLEILAPNGSPVDSLTFTGYGSFKSSGMSSTGPMVLATKAAMRDAAAKFLVQFPEQAITRKLLAGTPLLEAPAPAAVAAAAAVAAPKDDVEIETVPIVDSAPPPEPARPVEPSQDDMQDEKPQPDTPAQETAPTPATPAQDAEPTADAPPPGST